MCAAVVRCVLPPLRAWRGAARARSESGGGGIRHSPELVYLPVEEGNGRGKAAVGRARGAGSVTVARARLCVSFSSTLAFRPGAAAGAAPALGGAGGGRGVCLILKLGLFPEWKVI